MSDATGDPTDPSVDADPSQAAATDPAQAPDSSSDTTQSADASQDSTSDTAQTTASQGTAASNPVVEVKLRVFIPSPALTAISFSGRRAFAGDGRDFSYSDGTSRAELVGHVTVAVPGSGGKVTLDSRAFGLSQEFSFDDAIDSPGKPDWWKDLKPGFTVIGSDTQTATDDHLNMVAGAGGSTTEAVFSVADNTTVAAITVDGALPLMTGAPAIDADLYVHFKVDGGRVMGLVHGMHDGFPAYEIYFNQQLAYQYDPVAAGNSPTQLLPPEDITANTSYIDCGSA
jgi:hypothetical protein